MRGGEGVMSHFRAAFQILEMLLCSWAGELTRPFLERSVCGSPIKEMGRKGKGHFVQLPSPSLASCVTLNTSLSLSEHLASLSATSQCWQDDQRRKLVCLAAFRDWKVCSL